MKVSGNARIYLNRFPQQDGSTRTTLSVGVFTQKKDSADFASFYIPVVLGKELKSRINEKTPRKFDVYIKDASLMAHEYKFKSEARLYVADWEAPHEEKKEQPEPKFAKKPEPNFEEVKPDEDLPF